MNQKDIITIIVFIFFISSITSTIFLTWKVNDIVIEGKTVGNISLTIINECGNGVCAGGENCPVDVTDTDCTDNTCYEPTCTDGCGQVAVADGSTDEGCSGTTGCSGGNCQCNGAGTCRSGAAPSGGGAGGGGGGPSGGGGSEIDQDIKILTERIKAVTKVGLPLKQRITIQNPGRKSVEVKLTSQGVDSVLKIKEPQFIIRPGEIKVISIDIVSLETGVFTGIIFVTTERGTKQIPVTIEIETQQVLFDLSIDLKPKQLPAGEQITATVTIFNVNDLGLGQVNVEIDYFIKGLNNQIIQQDKETISLESQATLSKTYTIPETTADGEYVFIAQASYQSTIGTTSESFIVKRLEIPAPISKWSLTYTIIGFIIVIIIASIMFSKKIKHRIIQRPIIIKKTTKKIIDTSRLLKNQKLIRQKNTLEEAYQKGYISRDSYLEGKRSLESEIRKLK